MSGCKLGKYGNKMGMWGCKMGTWGCKLVTLGCKIVTFGCKLVMDLHILGNVYVELMFFLAYYNTLIDVLQYRCGS